MLNLMIILRCQARMQKKQLEIIAYLKENGKAKFSDISNEFGYQALSVLNKKNVVKVFF